MKEWKTINLKETSLIFLQKVFANLRTTPAHAEEQMKHFIIWIEEEPEAKEKIRQSLEEAIKSRSHTNLFTDSGLTGRHGFWSELFTRIAGKILPEAKNKRSLRGLLQELLGDAQDYLWIEAISDEIWEELIRKLDLGNLRKYLEPPLCESLILLANRICSLSLEKEMAERIGIKARNIFLELPKICYQYIENEYYTEANHPLKLKIIEYLDAAEELMHRVKKQQKNNGVSVDLVYLTIRINQNIDRLRTFLAVLQPNEQKYTALVTFLKELVAAENRKNSISGLFRESTEMLALQIVEHNSSEGEHYISHDSFSYFKSFLAALGGGLWVTLALIIKFLIPEIGAAPLMEALLFGLNYALCFIAIFVSGAALATKQPAMTAPALASEFEKNSDPEKTADLILWMARSQFASFLGNLLIVLPLPGFLAWLYYQYTGTDFIGFEKATHVLDSLNPLTSGSLVYAGMAGVFLFISSIITGYADNYIDYQKIPLRIFEHPRLNRWFSKKRLAKISLYVDKKGGGLVGNFVLGFLLGTAGFWGMITGLPFDIRHITISAGSTSFAFATLWHYLHSDTIFLVLIGVFFTGFFNFLVSFGLSLLMAMRSKGVSYHAQQELFLILTARLWYKPRDFFFPPIEKEKTEAKKHN